MTRLNLGSGATFKPGWINVDRNPYTTATVVHDLNDGIPYGENSVDEILCRGVIQYLSKPVEFLNECWRVLVNGGRFEFEVPLVDLNLVAAFSGITFKQYWSSEVLDRILNGNEYLLTDKFKRLEDPTDDGRMRKEIWRAIK